MPKLASTPYPDLNQVLHELVSSVRGILGEDFVGAYLQGSFAIGDFDAHSDVDFIIVTADDLRAVQVDALQSMHKRIYRSACAWAQHLEGSYFPRALLRSLAHAGKELWYLDHGADTLVRSGHCNTIIVRWALRQKGVVLAGPPPHTLIDPIPVAALRRYIRDDMRDWGQTILSTPDQFNNRFYQGFIVLSYCRMLHDLHTGANGSKRAGAEWAKAHLDPGWAGLIDRAWDCRPDPATSVRTPADPADFAHTLAFVQYVLQKSILDIGYWVLVDW
ncbi:MAG: DUF4111 domain-containing protein [Caldilineales bacterium]|nr:DUF4111 domain-containing protein [Caldilineales bacterium]